MKTEVCIEVKSTMGRGMDQESIPSLRETFLAANGRTTPCLDKDFTTLRIINDMKVKYWEE